MKQYILVLTILFYIQSVSYAQLPDGPYFGQDITDSEPEIFAPDLISLSDRKEMKITFSPDGQECFIGIVSDDSLRLLYTVADGGHWTGPVPIYFSGTWFEREPMISPDGGKLYFTAPQPGTQHHWLTDIWVSDKIADEWSTPVRLTGSVNSGSEEWHPSVTAEGTLYFCSNREAGKYYLYKAIPENGNYNVTQKLPRVINSVQYGAADPYIAPDESYLIFTSGQNTDQYISYSTGNGAWTNPKSLGQSVNSDSIEYGSFVSYNSEYYFFSRLADYGPTGPADIYWVNASFIDSLRHTNFSPYVLNNIPDQTVLVNTAYNYQIPDSVFYDDDGLETLTYTVTTSAGTDLPSWLFYDPEIKTFTGTPEETGSLDIKVLATDTAGSAVYDIFNLSILEYNDLSNTGSYAVNIFPNPASGYILISTDNVPESEMDYLFYGIDGLLLKMGKVQANVPIYLSDLKEGVYFIHLIIDGRSIQRKVVIQ